MRLDLTRQRLIGLRRAVLCLLLIPFLSSTSPAMPSFSSFRGVVVPIYIGPNEPASAIVRIARIRTELQRKAFFRIGFLRQVIVEDVELKLLSTNELEASLASAARMLRALSGKDFEIRGVRIIFPGTGERIIARKMEFSDDNWSLTNVRIKGRPDIQSEDSELPEAALVVAGSRIGELLVRRGTNTVVLNVRDDFSSKSTK